MSIFAKMKLAYYIKKVRLLQDPETERWIGRFTAAGCEMYAVGTKDDLLPNTDALLAIGGDGTFLSAAAIVAETGVPIIGVNHGRLGFLSENKPDEVLEPLLAGEYVVEEREMLMTSLPGADPLDFPYALNEVSVHRIGSGMMGVDVELDCETLPTYWADGLLVATSSGSTAYNLSVGGPICTPDLRAHIIAPIAPHNLNVRPLIVPASVDVRLALADCDGGRALLTLDNRSYVVREGTLVDIQTAPFSLRRIRFNKTNFIDALRSKLFWGEDARNQR